MMEYEDNRTQAIPANPDEHGVVAGEDITEEMEMNRLLEDVHSVNEQVSAIYPEMDVDPNMVFEQLEVIKNAPDRVFQVVNLLSQLHTTFLNNQQQMAPIAEPEPEQIPIVITDEDPDFEAVQERPEEDVGNVLEPIVIDVEQDQPLTTIPHGQPEARDIYVGLVKDVKLIMDIFPEANAEEVYAYLEARREEPQRVTNVIEELIHRRPVEVKEVLAAATVETPNEERKRLAEERAIPEHVEQVPPKKPKLAPESDVEPSTTVALQSIDAKTGEETLNIPDFMVEPASSTEIEDNANDEESEATSQRIATQLQVLKETFPDADQEYLLELVKASGHDENKLQVKVADMLENRKYPKLKDQLERERKKALKFEYSTRVFTPEEVLQWFEDPFKFFGDNSQPVSANYEQHALVQLENEFPKLLKANIKKAFLENKKHYTGAFHDLMDLLRLECKTQKFKRRKARTPYALPMEPDELFYKELAFTRIEDKLKEYLQTKETEHARRMEEARSSGELMTCLCCYDEENLLEDMIDCGRGHLFCKECVRRGAEVAIGDGKVGLECMSDKCENKFELPSLQLALKSSTFSNLLKKIQAEEICNAGIPDLVQCPHCSFAAIMPNQEDKVFRCLNPECLKETCRFCKEPNHVPLRCEEVEKSDEVKMRTYIENKMTDALVRECYRCNRRFMKEEGCNKMTCVCGATMCYVCRQPIKDYSHFQKGGCPQMCDTAKLHHTEVLKGAENAKKEFVEKHPEYKDKQLKHDPTKDLPNGSVEASRWGDEDDDHYDEDEDSYDEDYDHYDEDEDHYDEDDDHYDEDEDHYDETFSVEDVDYGHLAGAPIPDLEHGEFSMDTDVYESPDEPGYHSSDLSSDTESYSGDDSHEKGAQTFPKSTFDSVDENDSSSTSYKSSRFSDSVMRSSSPKDELIEISSETEGFSGIAHRSSSTSTDFDSCNVDSPTSERYDDNSSGVLNSDHSDDDSDFHRNGCSPHMHGHGSPVNCSTTSVTSSDDDFAPSPPSPPEIFTDSTEEDYFSDTN